MAGCIFCGKSPTTKTHIVRKAWLKRVLPGVEKFVHLHERRADGQKFDRLWESPEFGLAPSCTCAECNGGWMERIDKEGESLIEPCVQGHSATFDHNDQAAIARWVTLVSMLFDQTQADPVVSPERRAEFYETKEPLNGSQVWLAGTQHVAHVLKAWPRGLKMTDPGGALDDPNAYFATFRINHFLAQAFVPHHGALKDGFAMHRDGTNATLVTSIWPRPGTSVTWPPPAVLLADQIEEFANPFPREPVS